MMRDKEPPAETEQPATTQAATSRTVAMVAEQPPDATQPRHSSTVGDSTRPSHRPWSARRIPAALAALVIVAGTGILLFDISMVRAGHNAAAWRTRLAHE